MRSHPRLSGYYNLCRQCLTSRFLRASLFIRNRIRKGIPYFWIVEPQPASGYPPTHAGYFTEFVDAGKDRLKNLWSRIVRTGNYEHSPDFSFEQDYQNGEVVSLRNYLMKYLSKTFVDTIPDWSPEELVFNAIARDNGYRFCGCSRDLSTAMKRQKEKRPGNTWLCTTLQWPDRGHEEDKIIRKNPTWKKT